MSSRRCPTHSRRAGPAALAAAALLASATAAADPAGIRVDAFRPLATRAPTVCADTIAGMSGLCLLASTEPKVENPFVVRALRPTGRMPAGEQTVPFNRFLSLPPGAYLLYSAAGLDRGHEYRLMVYPGALTLVQTATVAFRADGSAHRLQHYQSENGIAGRGCAAEIIRGGVRAVLPGNYQVNLVEPSAANAAPRCLNTGVTFNVLAGAGVTGAPRTVQDQEPAPQQQYRHPNGVSSLASMSRFTADIERLAVLPGWQSFRGIHNPHAEAYDALVLSGIGTYQFVVPFTWRGRERECALSLAAAGLPSHVLLTDCRFSGDTLTDFRVNPGNYYTLNNRHGKTAIEGNYINNPILVQNVHFNAP